MTAEEERAQIDCFSVVHGHVGYLREAYHGEPYATRVLVPEAFETGEASIRASLLRERLPAALSAAEASRTSWSSARPRKRRPANRAAPSLATSDATPDPSCQGLGFRRLPPTPRNAFRALFALR